MYKSMPEHPAFTRGGSKAMMLKFWVGNRTDAEPNATPVIDGVLKTFNKEGQSLPEMFMSIATSDSFRFTGSSEP